MFRFFLSWRYLVARRTNLIGIVGIFVGVGALILILSIMTGFLEESRRAVRGSLSDLLIQPVFDPQPGDAPVPRDPGPLLHELRKHPEVKGATAELFWGGIITQRGTQTERILSSPTHNSLLVVELVGVDVRTLERAWWPAVRVHVASLGGLTPALRIQDEFDTTDLFGALAGGRGLRDEKRDGVDNPFLPFKALPGYDPRGRRDAGIVVGEQLAQNLGLHRGAQIQVATVVRDPRTDEYQINNRDFVVLGTFRSGENDRDLGRVYLERSELRDFLGGSQAFSQVLVKLEDYRGKGEAVRDELRVALDEAGVIRGGSEAVFEVRTWEEFRGNLLGAIENERVLMAIMLSLVLVVAGFTVFAILSMMVTEKRRDVGILCALGATPRGVLQLFLMIALWDALLGAFLGAFFGTWAALKIDAIERWLSSTLGIQIFNRDVYLFDHIPSIVQPLWVATIVLGAFVCALLFAAIPAWRAARMHPLEALRYE